MKSKLALKLLERRRSGVANRVFRPERFFQPANERFRGKFCPAFMRRPNRDEHRMLERRKIATLAELQFLFEITREIVMTRKLDRGRERCVSLNENLTRTFAPSGTPRHLR